MERNRSGQLNTVIDLLSQIGKNFLMGISPVRRWRLKRPRTSTLHENIDEFLKSYAFSSLNLLLENTGEVRGKSVCEIGPGDYLTSGISILAAGASRYGVIDRFPGDYFGEPAKQWYRTIGERWGEFYPERHWAAEPPDGFPENAAERLELCNEPLESAVMAHRYDIVCSFQVGEHVSDIDAFAEFHNRVLNSGGIGLHRVDFGPHDCWAAYRDPSTFLRFPDRVWNLTGSNRGVTNRKRHHEFLEAFEGAGLNVEVLYTDSFDKSMIDLKKLDWKFRQMPVESVLTGTAIYRITP